MIRKRTSLDKLFLFLLFVFGCAHGLGRRPASDLHDLDGRLSKYKSKPALLNGPNCVQASAYLLGITDRMTFMTLEELKVLLDKSKCQKLDDRAHVLSRDLAVITQKLVLSDKTSDEELVHAFVWANYPDEVYSRTGRLSGFDLERTKFSTIEKWQQFNRKCLDNAALCSTMHITHYRCPENMAIQETSPELRDSRLLLEKWIFDGNFPTEQDVSKMKQKLEIVFKKTKALTKEHEEARSLMYQLQILADPD